MSPDAELRLIVTVAAMLEAGDRAKLGGFSTAGSYAQRAGLLIEASVAVLEERRRFEKRIAADEQAATLTTRTRVTGDHAS